MNKKYLCFIIGLLSINCSFASNMNSNIDLNSPEIKIAITGEAKKLKADTCEPIIDRVMAAKSKDGKHLLISLPYEGCGGGNNWGSQTVLFSEFEGRVWKVRKEMSVSSVQKVYAVDDGFKIETLEYAPKDPRCCPSIKKTIPVKLPNKAAENKKQDDLSFNVEELNKINKQCELPESINKFFNEAFIYSKNSYKVKNGVSLSGNLANIYTKNEGDHSLLTVETVDTTWMDLKVLNITRAMGHENGISWFSVKFDTDKSSLIKTANKNGWKLDKKGHRSIDDISSVGIGDEKGKAVFVCDWSN